MASRDLHWLFRTQECSCSSFYNLGLRNTMVCWGGVHFSANSLFRLPNFRLNLWNDKPRWILKWWTSFPETPCLALKPEAAVLSHHVLCLKTDLYIIVDKVFREPYVFGLTSSDGVQALLENRYTWQWLRSTYGRDAPYYWRLPNSFRIPREVVYLFDIFPGNL